jgi:hydrogenase small subunit
MGCRGPTTYNACSTTRWNGGVSFPIQSGHGCIGCSEKDFWDNGPFYERLAHVAGWGVEGTADSIGLKVLGGVAVGLAGHAVASALKASTSRPEQPGGEK